MVHYYDILRIAFGLIIVMIAHVHTFSCTHAHGTYTLTHASRREAEEANRQESNVRTNETMANRQSTHTTVPDECYANSTDFIPSNPRK